MIVYIQEPMWAVIGYRKEKRVDLDKLSNKQFRELKEKLKNGEAWVTREVKRRTKKI